ncbi:hypothetical protein AXW67_00535 [Bradyrhizobium neotropicale]|uniref:Uncharacterized protein n=1 Tax=Bradyrhizobium neotropicale TaxID=1497615 RepID=A0A176Z3J7_9BRAD|nr:hypothetical protein AXW67_00535 [Bradyrhizobium neotropicale]
MSVITVTLDASKLEAWARELSARGLRNAIRRAVDKSATAARRIALTKIAEDIGVPRARLKGAVGKVRRTTRTDLSASFTATKARINIMSTSGASVTRGQGLRASTYRLTGGTSASLTVRSAFTVGGKFAAVRRGKSRLPIKGVFAETPSYALGNEKAVPRKEWQRRAEFELNSLLPREIEKQLHAEGLPYIAPPTDPE